MHACARTQDTRHAHTTYVVKAWWSGWIISGFALTCARMSWANTIRFLGLQCLAPGCSTGAGTVAQRGGGGGFRMSCLKPCFAHRVAYADGAHRHGDPWPTSGLRQP